MTGERRCVVLLRGINVGKGNRLAMPDLRDCLSAAGCQDVVTYLQSGNAVVTADPDGLAERVEAALPLAVRVVVFSGQELSAAVAACPWREQADASPKLVHVAFLDRLPAEADLSALGRQQSDDELAIGERVLYLKFADNSRDSPLAKALAKAKLDVVVTARNWRTVLALEQLLSDPCRSLRSRAVEL